MIPAGLALALVRETGPLVTGLLVRVKEDLGTTLIVVTHNIPSARRIGDTLLFLHQGRVVARGTVAELDRSGHPLVRQFMRSEAGG